jgi:hypothetical protein
MTETLRNADGEPIVTFEDTGSTVHEAWSAVMGEITHLGKDSRNAQQGFNFRGIDAVMNLLGPVLRTHGVSIVPSVNDIQRRDFTTAKGTVMRETVVEVTYTIIGPSGDEITGSAFGEASDAGDKSTPKAMSVAYRTFLLQALCLPTDEPDPDSQTHDRGTATPVAEEVAKTREGLLTATDIDTVKRVEKWASDKGLLEEPTTDTEGNSIPLHRLFEDTLARLGDTTADAAAEKVLADSLGATKVEEPPVEEPKA